MSAQPPATALLVSSSRDAASAALLWLLIVCTPFPLGQTGSIQLSHILLSVLVIIAITRPVVLDLPVIVLLLWIAFASYVLSVGMIWASLLGDFEPLIYALPIALGVATFFIVLLELRRNAPRVITILRNACLISLLLQGALLVVGQWDLTSARGTLFFANPNQLAYFALLAGSIFFACHHLRNDGSVAMMFAMSILTSGLLLFSRSKAGIVALAFLLVLAVARQQRGRIVVLPSIALITLAALPQLFEFFTEIVPTLLQIGSEQDESLAGRGYDRIWRFPQYLFFGAGEGAFQRFRSMYDVEIHSTLGSLIFSYGLVGAGLALLALVASIGRSLAGFLYLGPVMIYGLAHNGIRQPLLWVLLAVAVSFEFSSRAVKASYAQRQGQGSYALSKGDHGRIQVRR